MKAFIILPEGEIDAKVIEGYSDKATALHHAEEATKKTKKPYFVFRQIFVVRIVETVEVTGDK